LTENDLAAATECVNLIALVRGSHIPHREQFIHLIVCRLRAIVAVGAGEPCDERTLARWIDEFLEDSGAAN
jgi:hypothetical protein